jgi:hypothetical protein
MMVITPKHVGAVLIYILILRLKSCASVGVKTVIISKYITGWIDEYLPQNAA